MNVLTEFQNFNVSDAELSLWVFKKTVARGEPPRFTGRFVNTTDDLDEKLKEVISSERGRIEELQEYGLLTENNFNLALSINTNETYGELIIDQVKGDTGQKKVDSLDKVQNSVFYLIKLIYGNTVIHAIRKTDTSWRMRRALNEIMVVYSNYQLSVDKSPTLYLSKNIDFFILGGKIVILNKPNFESVLNYKEAHKNDFQDLQGEREFKEVFATTTALVNYVGENKIQLRRASAIRQKGHYKDPQFMDRLRKNYKNLRLNINFDADGKIDPTPDTCKDIFQALLDHRLSSAFSTNIYDVPDAKAIQ